MPKNNIVKTDGTIDYNHLGVMDDNITSNSNQIGILQGIDGYTTTVTRDANGNVSSVLIQNGSTTIQSATIIRDANGNVTSVSEGINGHTVTTTINRSSDGTISSVSKGVI